MSSISDYTNNSSSYGSGNFVERNFNYDGGLSKKKPNSKTDIYSPSDKLTINTELDATFGKDIYGRKISSIITEFLGYTSYEGANVRFATFIKKCNDLINKKNRTKLKNCKAAVILQTSYDENEVSSTITFLPQLEQLAKNYYVALRVISHREETLGVAISKVAKELEGRQIMTLIVRAHGNKDRLQLGEKSVYTTIDVNANDFVPLSPRASIILDSCLTGCDLAQKIASVQKRSVFACMGSFTSSFLTFCCDVHGYGLIAFDGENQIARRFKYEKKGYITEAIPCCVLRKDSELKMKKIWIKGIKIASESGDQVAQFNLGSLYNKGQGVSKSCDEAAAWYRKAAEQGYAIAQNNLGLLYAQGQGVSQSYDVAAKWCRNAAEQGYAIAQNNLGLLYAQGQGVPKSYNEAAQWYRKAAVQGDEKAQFNLGILYMVGQGVPQSYEEAAQWYRKAAEQGHAHAQFNLGVLYMAGQGVPKSYNEAAQWYRKAAVQGDEKAQFNLGILYMAGQGVPQSYEEAAQWYRKAAEQGQKKAQFMLGCIYLINCIYLKGQGILQSCKEEEAWCRKSAEKGDVDTIVRCRSVAQHWNKKSKLNLYCISIRNWTCGVISSVAKICKSAKSLLVSRANTNYS